MRSLIFSLLVLVPAGWNPAIAGSQASTMTKTSSYHPSQFQITLAPGSVISVDCQNWEGHPPDRRAIRNLGLVLLTLRNEYVPGIDTGGEDDGDIHDPDGTPAPYDGTGNYKLLPLFVSYEPGIDSGGEDDGDIHDPDGTPAPNGGTGSYAFLPLFVSYDPGIDSGGEDDGDIHDPDGTPAPNGGTGSYLALPLLEGYVSGIDTGGEDDGDIHDPDGRMSVRAIPGLRIRMRIIIR